ncbi:rRNA maturation RNase YbeY [Gaetbulibacter sp. M240]|uniref:rRNA maturation RNase YbeY n=1 Tax=Gaetbulibacter sp. M240 TaxID=3126511 RepID=UPI00374E6465
MIQYNFESDFELKDQDKLSDWIHKVVSEESCVLGDLNYVFCDDEYLHKINVEFLDHDTLTDIISFDYSLGKTLHGDIYISVERVQENAEEYNVSFEEELHRVMVHGILHYCGYKDKTKQDAKLMREKENHYLKLLG